MAISKLIPGFRFHPTGVELIKYFLKRKVMGKKFHDDVIAELDIYKYSPWDLPDMSYLKNGDLEWYFFCPIEKKYGSGMRMNRATEIGFWKATGKDRTVLHNNQIVGMIKTLIFHTGKAPRGDRTDWVMHEYRLEDKDMTDKGIAQDTYVLCKVFQKEGPGPRNGAQYGRPFNEEDWSDDDVGIPFAESAALVPSLPGTSNISVPNDQNLHAIGYNGSISMSCLSGLVPSPNPVKSCQSALIPSPDPANSCQSGLIPSPDPANSSQSGLMTSFNPANSCQSGLVPSPDLSNSSQLGLMPSPDPANHSYPDNQPVNNDDILSMLDISKDNDILPEENIAERASLGDFFDGLGDLDCLAALGSFSQNAGFSTNRIATMGDVMVHGDLDFVELIDLDSELFWQSTTHPESWS